MLKSLMDGAKKPVNVRVSIHRASDDNDDAMKTVIQYCVKHKIDMALVKYHRICLDEFEGEGVGVEFYYDRQETPVELLHRKKMLAFSDLREFVDCLGLYNYYCGQKSFLKSLLDNHCFGNGKEKYRLADWQEKLVSQFLLEKSVQEQVDAAYKEGKKSGDKELAELKKKLKDLTT